MTKKILVTGRLENRSETTKLTSIHVDKDVLVWIEENTSGNKQLVFNRLMQEGMKVMNKKKGIVVIEGLKS